MHCFPWYINNEYKQFKVWVRINGVPTDGIYFDIFLSPFGFIDL